MSGYILIVMFFIRVVLPIFIVLLAGTLLNQKKSRIRKLS